MIKKLKTFIYKVAVLSLVCSAAVYSAETARKPELIEPPKLDCISDLYVLNFLQEDNASLKFSRKFQRNFNQAQNLINNNKSLDKALALLNEIYSNGDIKNNGSGLCAVNILMSRGYFLKVNYPVSLKHSYEALMLTKDSVHFRSRALLLAAFNYIKMGQDTKANDLLFTVTKINNVEDAIKAKAEQYLKREIKK